jgi:hypothetical protein
MGANPARPVSRSTLGAVRSEWFSVALFFAALLAVGLFVYDDYGLSWDEEMQRSYGQKVWRYAAEGDQALLEDYHRHYGPCFQILLYAVERVLGLEDSRSIYLMRHLVSFLLFFAGAVFFYLLVRHLFRSWKLGLLGAGLLVLSPRIFAHSFFNPKDLPFMAVFVIAFYTLVRLDRKPAVGRALVHGMVCGILIDIRVAGLLLPAMTCILLAARALSGGRSGRLRTLGLLGLSLAATSGSAYALWPTLWTDPAGGLVAAIRYMGRFPWEGTVLYMGREVLSTELPWHYTPVWVTVSTPLVILFLAALGLGFSVVRVLRRSDPERLETVLVWIWLFLPPVYLAASDAVLYDGWRHSFFIYPALVILAVNGAGGLYGWIGGKSRGPTVAGGLVAAMIGVSLAFTLGFMVRAHPHETVYFNSLVRGARGAEGNFDLDYWGLSYRAGLEHVLAVDEKPKLKIYVATDPGRLNAQILRPRERRRLEFVDRPIQSNYYLTTFRWQDRRGASKDEFYSIVVDGAKILAIYQILLGSELKLSR